MEALKEDRRKTLEEYKDKKKLLIAAKAVMQNAKMEVENANKELVEQGKAGKDAVDRITENIRKAEAVWREAMKSFNDLKKKHDLTNAGKKVAGWTAKISQLEEHLKKRRGVTVELSNAWKEHLNAMKKKEAADKAVAEHRKKQKANNKKKVSNPKKQAAKASATTSNKK